MNNVVPLRKPDRIQRLGIRVDRDWSIRQFDAETDRTLSLFDTQPIPLWGTILAGPATELDAHPDPEPARHVHRNVALAIASGTFLLGSLVTIVTLWVMLR